MNTSRASFSHPIFYPSIPSLLGPPLSAKCLPRIHSIPSLHAVSAPYLNTTREGKALFQRVLLLMHARRRLREMWRPVLSSFAKDVLRQSSWILSDWLPLLYSKMVWVSALQFVLLLDSIVICCQCTMASFESFIAMKVISKCLI